MTNAAARSSQGPADRTAAWALLLAIALVPAGHLFRIAQDRAISGWDVPNHLLFSLEFHDRAADLFHSPVSAGSKAAGLLRLVAEPMPNAADKYTNFLGLLTLPFYGAFGPDLYAARFGNLLYLLILGVSVYFWGLRLGSREIGLTAAFLTLAQPMVFESARQFGLDLPLTAAAAAALLLLERADFSSPAKTGPILGLALGLGLLVKPQFAVHAGAPLALRFARTAVRPERRRALVCWAAAAVVALLVSWPWWGFPRETFYAQQGIRPLVWLAARLLMYLKALVFSVIGIPLFAIFAPSLVRFARSRAAGRETLLAWLIGAVVFYAGFCALFWHFDRFLMPALPAVALISAWGIHSIRKTRLRAGVLFGAILFFGVQFCALTFDAGAAVRQTDTRSWGLDRFETPVRPFNSSAFGLVAHKGDPHRVTEVIDAVRSLALGRPATVVSVLLSPGDPRPFELRYRFRAAGRDLQLFDLWGMPPNAFAELDRADFILFRIPDGETKVPGWPERAEFEALIKGAPGFDARFNLFEGEWAPIREALFAKLYGNRTRFAPVRALETGSGFAWHLYRRTESDTMR